MKTEIELDGKVIEVDLITRKRKTIGIIVQIPSKVRVLAPVGLKKELIIQTVKSKGPWILQKLEELEKRRLEIPRRDFVDGETIPFLGEQYELVIIPLKQSNKVNIRLEENRFIVHTPNSSKEYLREALVAWYKSELHKVIRSRVAHFQKYFKDAPSEIVVKNQKAQWASCTSKRKLLFNWRLALAPLAVIEYVVVHEMSHMVHMNHSKEFWALVESILPDYKEHRKWLKEFSLTLSFDKF